MALFDRNVFDRAIFDVGGMVIQFGQPGEVIGGDRSLRKDDPRYLKTDDRLEGKYK